MPGFVTKTIAKAPGLRRIPIVKVLLLGELLRLARDHANKLTPKERERILDLVKKSRGVTTNLQPAEREELKQLVLKAEPRAFAGDTANFFSPIPIPRRLRHGKRKPAAAGKSS